MKMVFVMPFGCFVVDVELVQYLPNCPFIGVSVISRITDQDLLNQADAWVGQQIRARTPEQSSLNPLLIAVRLSI